MNKAEERAFERYPDYREMNGEYVTQIHKRKVFVEGYHQAEKDNELSWRDVRDILNLYEDVIEMDFCKDIYGEVLKRFKERRK